MLIIIVYYAVFILSKIEFDFRIFFMALLRVEFNFLRLKIRLTLLVKKYKIGL